MTTLYHLTARRNLRRILSEGFRDGDAGRRTRSGRTGVWFSDRPRPELVERPFAAVEIELLLSEQELRDYEWSGGRDGSRSYLIPAERINDHCLLHVIGEAEALALALARA
jgi:hypothetical protein